MRPERLTLALSCILVIALTPVILASSVPEESRDAKSQAAVELLGPKEPAAAPKEPLVVVVDSAPVAEKPSAKSASVESASKPESAESEANKRQGRSESPSSPVAAAGESDKADAAKQASAAPASAAASDKPATEKSSTPAAKSSAEKLSEKAASKPNKPAPLSAKSSASKSKLPANLGTVTSTGSGGPTHYMSKHDAYSAIAEKHGALAHDAMMKKADKRQTQLHSFSGIQKASGGIGDVLNPFKGVTDGGLARTLGASMRSIIKGKYSVPAYVASALLGAVALMAFYESPISPLPVPPLPEPPVGRFPPEMPNISPNIQVPFRTNQQQQQQQQYGQQNYNQRSFNPRQPVAGYQQPQQVLFPGASNMMPAQQRQGDAPGPVQQLAANLLSTVGKQQSAQRKSGVDYDQSSSRSFFGSSSSNGQISPKMGSVPTGQQQKPGSFLSFFGLGGSESPSASAPAPVLGASSQIGAASGSSQISSPVEPKGNNHQSSTNLSGSHLVNKVKSFFSRSPSAAGSSSSSSSISAANANPYDQYSRMSFVQALMKDAAFLPGYLTPTRKSSNASPAQSSASSSNNKLSSSAIPSAQSSSASIAPAARMQVGNDLVTPFMNAMAQQQQQQVVAKQQQPKSSYGLVKAADRIAHALLETFTSGIMQRHASPASSGQQGDAASRKSAPIDESSPLVSAGSLLSDIMSSYSSAANAAPEQHQQPQQQHHIQSQQEPQPKSASSSPQTQPSNQQNSPASKDQLTARSGEVSASSSSDSSADHSQEHQKQPQASPPSQSVAPSGDNKQVADPKSQASPQSAAPHVRKTRSIGLEYPIESNQALALREQQPSKAAQINNVIDFVADSYTHNRLLFNFVMNQVGLSQAVPYVEQILAIGNKDYH